MILQKFLMRDILYLLPIFVLQSLLGCSGSVNSNLQNKIANKNIIPVDIKDTVLIEKKKSDSIPPNYDDLLNFFKNIDFKLLHVYSTYDKPKGDKFKGVLLNSTYAPIFINAIIESGKGPKKQYIDYIHACFRFKINPNYLGLIMRSQEGYDATAIDLWIFNMKEKKLVWSLNLADAYGDENWYFKKDAWIETKNENFIIVTRQKDYEMFDEINAKDKVISDKFEYYIFDKSNFIRIDTIKLNQSNYKLF
jgi:hypothetical protein